MALQDTDNFIVGRGSASHKIEYKELKDSIITGGTSDTYVEVAGDNMTGNLTLGTDKVVLNATSGAATFKADTTIHGLTVGVGPGTANTSSVLGSGALAANTSGNNNVAVGNQTLSKNTEGGNNTAIGTNAGLNNTSGTFNTYVGYQSGYYLTGLSNTILGAYLGSASETTLNSTVIISAGKTERARCNSTGAWSFPGVVAVGTNLTVQNGVTALRRDVTGSNALLTLGTSTLQYGEITVDARAKLKQVSVGAEGAWDKITLNTDGSASFASTITAGGYSMANLAQL